VKKGKEPTASVGLTTRFYYKTLEYGRKPFKLRQKPEFSRAGSPDMKRFAFFGRAVNAHRGEVSQLLVDATRTSLFKEAGRLAVKLNAPVKVR